MANKISVIIDVAVDKANRGVKSFQKSIKDADGAVGKFKAGAGSAFNSLQANAGAFGLAVGGALVAIGTKAVQAASDLEQSVGGIEKAFGNTSDAILEIGKSAAESMGLSQRAFNEGALALSAFAEDIARDTGEPVEKVVQDLMTRAADFAAAYGTTVPEAVRIFSSTLSGESEPIKKFGIIVNETETKAYAAEAGIEDMGKATQRAGLLMQDTAKFAGQFADESDTLAGQTERLTARWENAQAALGERLLPVVTEGITALNDLATASERAGVDTEKWADRATTAWTASLGGVGLFATAFMKANSAIRGESDDTAANEEANQKRIASAYIQNQMGLKRYQEQLAADEHVKAYLDHQRGMQRETEETAEAAEEAAQRAIDAYDRLNRKLDDRSAYLDIEDAFYDVGQAAEAVADTTDKSFAEQSQDARDHERSLIALKGQVLEYAEEVGDLPPQATTDILALIDEGKLMEAAIKLEALEKTRTVRINPVIGPVIGGTGLRIDGARASGGPVSAGGTYLVGEDGPELLQMGGSGGNVVANDNITAGGGGNTIHIGSIHALNPQQAAKEITQILDRYGRNGGPR